VTLVDRGSGSPCSSIHSVRAAGRAIS